ncbi:hypothetical protein, partial [Limnospira fusiformis]
IIEYSIEDLMLAQLLKIDIQLTSRREASWFFCQLGDRQNYRLFPVFLMKPETSGVFVELWLSWCERRDIMLWGQNAKLLIG